MKALLPENDDFLNCMVFESLLELYIVNSIILRDSSTAQFNLKKDSNQNHVNKLKDSKQDSLLLVYKYLNSAGPSCTILSVFAKVAVFYRYSTSCVGNDKSLLCQQN